MMAGFTPTSVVSPCHDRSQAWACAPRRGVGGGRRLRLFSLPFGRLRRGEIPAFREKPFIIGKNSYSVAPIWRDNMQVVGRAAWGRVCGRAKLLAGTLRCLHLCWRLPWDWSDAEQLGRCPKPHKGAPPLDPARGDSPLTLFWRPGLNALPMLCPAGGFCPFLPFLTGTRT